MDNITEKFLQELGFNCDSRSGECYLCCGKYLYINVQFYSPDEYYVDLEINGATASLYHVTTKQKLLNLVKALSGEDI